MGLSGEDTADAGDAKRAECGGVCLGVTRGDCREDGGVDIAASAISRGETGDEASIRTGRLCLHRDVGGVPLSEVTDGVIGNADDAVTEKRRRRDDGVPIPEIKQVTETGK